MGKLQQPGGEEVLQGGGFTSHVTLAPHTAARVAGLQACAFSPAEPSYPGVVQPPQSAAAAGPLLHRPPALRPAEGAVSGDPHALHHQQVGTHTQVAIVFSSEVMDRFGEGGVVVFRLIPSVLIHFPD